MISFEMEMKFWHRRAKHCHTHKNQHFESTDEEHGQDVIYITGIEKLDWLDLNAVILRELNIIQPFNFNVERCVSDSQCGASLISRS